MKNVVLMALVLTGCMPTYQGEVVVGSLGEPKRFQDAPLSARVHVQRPVVQDKDGDFTAIKERFCDTLQQTLITYVKRARVFERVEASQYKDSFKIATRISIANYRSNVGGVGGVFLAIGGWTIPPVLGFLWAGPLYNGTMEGELELLLFSPEGKLLLKKSGPFSGTAVNGTAFSQGRVAVIYQGFMAESALEVRLALKKQGKLQAAAPQPASAPAPRATKPVVVVFPVHDLSGQLGKPALKQLSEYLIAKLAEGSYRVVPEDSIKRILVEEKKKSYRKCFDRTCQIELGKAVSANKMMATKVMKVGKECVVTAVLFDLKTEASEKAVTKKTACTAAGVMGAVDSIVSGIQ